MNHLANVINKPKRLLNVEVLRVLSMFMIVCNHFLGHGLSLQDYDLNDSNRFILWFLRGVCYMGTNLFILISAYFQCKSRFKAKSILLLLCQVFFYSIILYGVSIALGLAEFSYSGLVKVLFPVLTSSYWFVTCYVGLYILAPFINKLIQSLSKDQLKKLILILFVFFSVVPNIFYSSSWLNWGGSSGIVWFIFLYLVAAYIRLYVDIAQISLRKLLPLLILFMLLPLISKIIIANLSLYFTGNIIGSSIFFVKNSIIIFPMSVLFFLTFMKINISGKISEKIVPFFASSIFAVYLISENIYLREYLWSWCVRIVGEDSTLVTLYVVAIPIAVLLSCIFIDQIRKCFFFLCGKTGVPQSIEKFISRYTSKIYIDL